MNWSMKTSKKSNFLPLIKLANPLLGMELNTKVITEKREADQVGVIVVKEDMKMNVKYRTTSNKWKVGVCLFQIWLLRLNGNI